MTNSLIRSNMRMISSSRMVTGKFCRKSMVKKPLESMVKSRLEIALEQVYRDL